MRHDLQVSIRAMTLEVARYLFLVELVHVVVSIRWVSNVSISGRLLVGAKVQDVTIRVVVSQVLVIA